MARLNVPVTMVTVLLAVLLAPIGLCSIVTIKDCTNSKSKTMVKMRNYVVRGGTLIHEMNSTDVPCMQECLRLDCELVTQVQDESGYTCQFYQKPYISSEHPTTTGVAYLEDYCSMEAGLMCLPTEYIHFDGKPEFAVNSGFYTNSFDGFEGAHYPALKAQYDSNNAQNGQFAILSSETSDSCSLRPHLCTNGFTVSFYCKIGAKNPNSAFAGLVTSRTSVNNVDTEGFSVVFSQTTKLEFQVIVPRYKISGEATLTGVDERGWTYLTMTYRYDASHPGADTMTIYERGVAVLRANLVQESRQMLTHSAPTPYRLVFGRVYTDISDYYCKCWIDELEIYEMELNAEQVKSVYDKIAYVST